MLTACAPPVGTLKDANDTAEQSVDSVTFGGIRMTPAVVNFGGIPMGSSSTESLTITNGSSGESMVTTATVDSERFVVDDGIELPITLDVDESATIDVTYTPSRMDEQDGTLNIGVAGQVGYAEIGLIGQGTDDEVTGPSDTGEETEPGALSVTPTSIDFGNIPAMSESTESIELTNTGDSDITITDIVSTSASIFSTEIDPLAPITITPGSSVELEVTFRPPTEGDFEAIIDVDTDVLGENVQIPVSGSGDSPDCEVCAPRLEVMTSTGTSSTLDLAPAFGFGCTANGTVTLKNTGDMDLEITAVNVMNNWFDLLSEGNFSASWTGPLTIPPGGSSFVAIDYVTDGPNTEVSDIPTDQNVVHILSNDPSQPDWVVALSATLLFCG